MLLRPILAAEMSSQRLLPHSKSAVLSLPAGRQVCYFLCTSKKVDCPSERPTATRQYNFFVSARCRDPDFSFDFEYDAFLLVIASAFSYFENESKP